MKKKTEFKIVMWFVIGFALCCLGSLMSGCKSPYPTCDAVGQFRCQLDILEVCDGANWQPRLDCAEAWFNGQAMAYECVQRAGAAMCEVVR